MGWGLRRVFSNALNLLPINWRSQKRNFHTQHVTIRVFSCLLFFYLGYLFLLSKISLSPTWHLNSYSIEDDIKDYIKCFKNVFIFEINSTPITLIQEVSSPFICAATISHQSPTIGWKTPARTEKSRMETSSILQKQTWVTKQYAVLGKV